MSLATYFRASSYTMIAVAMLALMLAGGLNLVLGAVFAVVMIVAWNLEGKKWQLSERVGLAVVLLSIPLFLLDWKYQSIRGEAPGRLGVNALAHLIVFLSAIKLLQVKSDRDWVFLYLISFFELLLAAGLSFSPVFLATLTLYLLCSLSTVMAFEIRKAQRGVKHVETRLLVPPVQDFSQAHWRSRQTGCRNRPSATHSCLDVGIHLCSGIASLLCCPACWLRSHFARRKQPDQLYRVFRKRKAW